MRVALFCGGRGSASIIRALLERGDIELTLLINAYDDGRSTGVLRTLVPGLPGPADFRKNLALLAGGAPAGVFEHRLGGTSELARWQRALSGGGALPRGGLRPLEPAMAEELARDLASAQVALAGVDEDALADCALGNLVILGRWLREGRHFGRALDQLGALFAAPARPTPVDTGESRYLVALKQDGALLASEWEIVSPQSAVAIDQLFLLDGPLDAGQRRELQALDPDARRRALGALHRPASISPGAADALARADVIIYGPGTQFSSLLPSYAVRGVADAIAGGKARSRILVMNLHHDHDIVGMSAAQVVERARRALGDSSGARGLVSHVLFSAGSDGMQRGAVRGLAEWIEQPLESAQRPGVHDGRRVAELVLRIGGTGQ